MLHCRHLRIYKHHCATDMHQQVTAAYLARSLYKQITFWAKGSLKYGERLDNRLMVNPALHVLCFNVLFTTTVVSAVGFQKKQQNVAENAIKFEHISDLQHTCRIQLRLALNLAF